MFEQVLGDVAEGGSALGVVLPAGPHHSQQGLGAARRRAVDGEGLLHHEVHHRLVGGALEEEETPVMTSNAIQVV